MFSFSVDPADPNSNTNTFVLFLCYKMNYLCIWVELDILASFNISFGIQLLDLNRNTNPSVLLLCKKMTNLCIQGKLNILASFNISGNILCPKVFFLYRVSFEVKYQHFSLVTMPLETGLQLPIILFYRLVPLHFPNH